MRTSATKAHTVTHILEHTDVLALLRKGDLIPLGLDHFSVEVKGGEVSTGCTIIIRSEVNMQPAELDLLLYKPK